MMSLPRRVVKLSASVWPTAANFSIPRVGPDFHEVPFLEYSPPTAAAIVAQQQQTVCLLGLTRHASRFCPLNLMIVLPTTSTAAFNHAVCRTNCRTWESPSDRGLWSAYAQAELPWQVWLATCSYT